MPNTLDERDWKLLLERIRDGKCTPFLGAGACFGVCPLGSDIARAWAREYNYPLTDGHDLARVAQFLAVQHDSMFPKERILEQFFNHIRPPDFGQPDEPHALLAELPLPIYMTTNYDDLMVQALKNRHREPYRELCRWNSYVEKVPSVFDSAFNLSVANPVVFHLHGHDKHVKAAESLVLTEDDYLDFLVKVTRDLACEKPRIIPPRIQEALTGTSLLFIGYRLADWSFRVLFRGLIAQLEGSLRRVSVTAQLLPELVNDLAPTKKQAQEYLNEYFGKIDVRVYWGTAREFSSELRQRCLKEVILK